MATSTFFYVSRNGGKKNSISVKSLREPADQEPIQARFRSSNPLHTQELR